MGCSKPNQDDNPSIPLKQGDELSLTSIGGEASDYGQISRVNNTPVSAFVPFPFSCMPNTPWEAVHGMHQSYTQDPRIGNHVPGFMRPGTSQNTHCDDSFRGSLRDRDTCSSGLNHPQMNVNFVPSTSTMPRGYYTNAYVGEGRAGDVKQSQITENSLYSGCNSYVPQSTRQTVVNNDANVSASYPGKIDGSFLTLGIGGLQNNLAGFPGSIYSSFGAPNNDGFPHYGTVGPSSNAFQNPYMPKQYDFFDSNGRNLGIASKSPGAYLPHGPYDHYQGDSTPDFLPCSNTNACISNHGFTKFSGPAPESPKLMRTSFQPTMGHPQNYLAKSNRDINSSFNFNSCSLTASPVTRDYLGRMIPSLQGSTTQAIRGHVSSAVAVGTGATHGNTTFPEKILPQIAESTAIKPATVGPFPRRLGVQPGDGMPPRVMGVQTRSDVQSQPVQLAKSPLGASSGYASDGLSPPFNVQAPLFSSGPGKVDKPSQVSNATGQPSLKRKAVESSQAASWGRRRKLMHPSILLNSVYQRQGNTPYDPSGTPHIRWQGFDKVPQPLGRKCLVCNRDLSFTPEGPISQPSIPPAVAVLPCGHAFHDQCLQRITPEDQIKDPPCIPCAIGET